MVRRFSSEVLALVVVLLFGQPARADSEADALVAKAIELRKEHRDAEALKLLREAWAKEKTPRTQAQLALAEQAVGAWLDAERDLSAALSHGEDPWIAKNVEPLKAALETIRSHLAWMAIEGPAGAEVFVDGVSAGVLPLSRVRVVAGTVHVEVSAPGFVTSRKTVEVSSGQEAKATFVLDAIPAEKPVVQPPVVKVERVEVPSGPSAVSFLGIGLASAGIVSLGVGAYFGIRTFAKKSDRDAHCSAGCDSDGVVADREARSSASVANIALGVGLVATAVGVVIVLRERATVAPAVGPHTAALSLHVRW